MNYICTWLCADEKGEESTFPQTGQISSSKAHQDIYWRCVLLFYVTSRRFNKQEKHLLFTNIKKLPIVDGRSIDRMLRELEVEVVITDFKYKTPKGYYNLFQNQFYEFSILEYISSHAKNEKDSYLILDSDCIFLKPANKLFEAAASEGFISFEDHVEPGYVINGLSRNDLKSIYQELLDVPVSEIPSYHLGEFFLASVKNIRKIYADFTELWPRLLDRHEKGLKKFNEEAHTLSYLYFKNGFRASQANHFMKRIWTNPLFYRNVIPSDTELSIWHLPSEKTFGLLKLYDFFFNRSRDYGLEISNAKFLNTVQKILGIPYLPFKMRMEYYTLSYYRAIKKRMPKLAALSKLF